MHCPGGEDLAGDVPENSGGLCSILYLPRGNRMESAMTIGNCELARMTRMVLLKVGMV
jgi:hypothetical protein